MLIESFFLIIGLVLLYYGSEFLVKGASSTALLLSVKPVIVGITIVSFATSAPELLVSLVAAFNKFQGISVGNILGSNVINIGLVLGLSAVFKTIHIHRQIIRFDMPFMLAACVLFGLFCMDGHIDHIDGAILLGLLIGYLILGILNSKDKNNTIHPEKTLKKFSINLFLVVFGIAALAKGVSLVVESAIYMARSIGLTEAFIGISIIAMGTSLPELATSVVAAAKNESDLSLGNIVGSNLFNICLVMGTIGLISPIHIDKAILNFPL
ncbi:MAG: calcium/sodium antiporter [Thermodesulfobacteriota bacterium]|nr:calcium/sodium antiporter [Thermodesulfobacteriota bacterium]